MSQTTCSSSLELSDIDRIVAEHGTTPDAVLPILHAIQDRYHYLPRQALQHVCAVTRITPAAIESISTFYARFRHKPAGEYIVSVCHGTACHVKGADLVQDAVDRALGLEPGHDTDARGRFTTERVGCLGCCTLAPVLRIDDITFGHQTPDEIGRTIANFAARGRQSNGQQTRRRRKSAVVVPELEFRIGCNSCCLANGAGDVKTAMKQAVGRLGGGAVVKEVGCWGICHQTPLVEITSGGRRLGLYGKVEADFAADIVRNHLPAQGLWARLSNRASLAMETLTGKDTQQPIRQHTLASRAPVCQFLGPQRRIATEFYGEMDPLDLDDYLRHGGFSAAKTAVVQNAPDALIDQIKASGLRGRGGAGFPTGEKWARTRAVLRDVKYIICNGDEGDPGAFMDRMILESFPFRVIEGMIIASLAVGAREGILYIRHEYPLALERIRAAIPHCERQGFLGQNIFGSGHCLKLRVVEGGGAFICGEETAMIASIEGERGTPRLRPPFPAESGLWGKPTCINNVETYAMVPWIVRNGAAAFAGIGTAASKGTKVFALTGKIARGGLIEVPMGITIRQIVDEIGGGIANGRKFKAVQIGGPSGGCVPASMADLPVDYESLAAAGAIMGSGGMVVLDDADCMVDMARYFLQFTQAESCGKCSFCRVGTKVMLQILDRLCAGQGKPADLKDLEDLCATVRQGSLCGLGQTAPNPVLTTLRYFRDEYEAHVQGRCPAGRCKSLIHYRVNERCNGCTLCAQNCPSAAIPMTPYVKHVIDNAKCTRCDICRSTCPEQAIDVIGTRP